MTSANVTRMKLEIKDELSKNYEERRIDHVTVREETFDLWIIDGRINYSNL